MRDCLLRRVARIEVCYEQMRQGVRVHSLIETVPCYDKTNQIEIRFRLTQDTRQIDVASNSTQS